MDLSRPESIQLLRAVAGIDVSLKRIANALERPGRIEQRCPTRWETVAFEDHEHRCGGPYDHKSTHRCGECGTTLTATVTR